MKTNLKTFPNYDEDWPIADGGGMDYETALEQVEEWKRDFEAELRGYINPRPGTMRDLNAVNELIALILGDSSESSEEEER